MAETLAASGGSISNVVVEDFPSTQEITAMCPECFNPASTSKTPPYSARIAAMTQNREKYSSQVEFDIASSEGRWSAVENDEEGEDDEEKHDAAVLKANKEAFENLKSHPHWGHFFSRGSLLGGYWAGGQVGKKIAEGGQAEIYETPDSRFLLKVFKRGSLLQELQKQWPQTVFDEDCDELGALIHQGHVLDDGRFAFLMRKFWGDLRRYIDLRMLENKNSGPPFTLAESILLTVRVAEQMSQLHSRGICHKDLKADNILVSEHVVPEIVDFFLLTLDYPSSNRCRGFRIADYECSIGVRGTTFWRAPEILLAERKYVSAREKGIDPPAIPFSKASDVYSFGMLLYEILTGFVPFEREGFYDEPSDENYDRVILGARPELPDDMDVGLKVLMTKCWHGDAKQRPTFEEIEVDVREVPLSWSNSEFMEIFYWV